METLKANRICGALILGLSLTALLTVLSGYFGPKQLDEGAAAHIFQLAILFLVPATAVFLFTSDWKYPARNLRALALPVSVLVLAFGSLFYLEHYR